MPKLAILTFYHRIFVTRTFRRIVLVSIVLVILGTSSLLVPILMLCKPLDSIWTPDLPAKCINFKLFVLSSNILNVIVDIWIFVLPIPVIVRMQISTSRKLALSTLFLLGLS